MEDFGYGNAEVWQEGNVELLHLRRPGAYGGCGILGFRVDPHRQLKQWPKIHSTLFKLAPGLPSSGRKGSLIRCDGCDKAQ